MVLSWCFKSGCVQIPRFASLLIILSALVTPAWSHSDLLLQIEELNLAVASRQTDAELLVRRGELYRRHEDFAAAAVDLAAARAAQPDYPLLDLYEGMLLLDTGEPAGAEELLGRYLQDHPRQASAWILRARARLALGQAEPAAQDYAQAIRYADQPSPELYRDWSLALVAARADHWSAARDVVDVGLGLFPREVSLLALGTDIALAENQPGVATAYVKQLPPTITRLGKWQTRLELAGCLTRPDEVEKQECRRTAIRVLEEQLAPPDF